MKKFCAVFALFCVMFLFAACGGDGTTKIVNEQNSDDSSSETNDSDSDPSSQDPENQNDEEISDFTDNSDGETDTTPDDADPTDDNADSGDDEDFIDPDVTDTGETVGETRVADCTGLPENASWNTVSAIVQTWNGEKWIPSSVASFDLEGSEDECRFKCDTNYGWNGSICSADVKNAYCDAKPENSVWNDGGRSGTFAQTWSGSAWTPASHASVYSKSAVECGFVCATGYIWDGSACEVAPTQIVECTGLPLVGAEWNTASTITQTWDGEKWIPESTTGVYNENPSTEECRFKCKEHYSWKNSECAAGKKNSPCMNLPTNGQWNTVNSIEQTWSGSDWQPSTTGVYSETASTKECRFVCKTNYKWNVSTSKCDPETNVADCTDKPENSIWNGSGKFEQTWNGENWYPATYEATYNKTPGICTFVCDTGFIWDETSCVSAPTMEAFCQDKPANTVWNTVDKITQTYNGADWEPSTTSVYNEEASDRECRFKCASAEYTWNGSSCSSGGSSTTPCDPNPCLSVANSTQECSVFGGTNYKCECNSGYYWDGTICGTVQTQTAACTGLISNAEWNTVSEIIQKWDDYMGTWVPTANGSYNENPSTNQCRFRCKEKYFWSDSKCVSPCTSNPCGHGTCTAINISEYSCECDDNYFFDPDSGKCVTPCNSFRCSSDQNSSCVATSPTAYICECKTGSTWNESESKCLVDPANLPACNSTSATPCRDSSSGLTWSARASSDYTWQDAVDYCSSYSEGGLSGWHLPTISELRTLIQNCSGTVTGGSCGVTDSCLSSSSCWTSSACYSCYYDSTGGHSKFGEIALFWSSSTRSDVTDTAWYVSFSSGGVSDGSKTNSSSVRCVR